MVEYVIIFEDELMHKNTHYGLVFYVEIGLNDIGSSRGESHVIR